MATKNDPVSCSAVMIATFLLFLLLFWGGGMMGFGGMMGGGWWNGGMMYGGGNALVSLFFWAVVIILVYYILKGIMTRHGEGEPLDVLNRRYAAGEIGRAEYLRMKKELSSRR